MLKNQNKDERHALICFDSSIVTGETSAIGMDGSTIFILAFVSHFKDEV